MLPIPNHALFASPCLSAFAFLPPTTPAPYYHLPPLAPHHYALYPYLPPFHLHIRAHLLILSSTPAGQAQIAANHATLAALRTYATLAFTAADLAAATATPPPTPELDPILLTGILARCRFFVRCPACALPLPFHALRPPACLHCNTVFTPSDYPAVEFLSAFDEPASVCYPSKSQEDQHAETQEAKSHSRAAQVRRLPGIRLRSPAPHDSREAS